MFGGALVLLSAGFPVCRCAAQARRPPILGCALPEPEARRLFGRADETRVYATGQEPIIANSNDREFDYALAQILARMSDLFEVSSGFAYYDDGSAKNAYATKEQRLNGTDGTVLFGRRLLAELRGRREHPEIAVASVCAHEFAHVLQFKTGLFDRLNNQPTVKRIELQADFFAGYFAGKRKRERPSFPAAVFAVTQEYSGDNMIENPQHHGTPEERAAAVVAGYESGFRQNAPLSDAKQTAMNYVSRL